MAPLTQSLTSFLSTKDVELADRGAVDACRAALLRTAASASAVRSRTDALLRRFGASRLAVSDSQSNVNRALDEDAREATISLRSAIIGSMKAAGADAEEARVCAAQLEAYVLLLEETRDGTVHDEVVLAAARTLSDCGSDDVATALRLEWNASALWYTVEASLRVRDGVHPAHCVVDGVGIATYVPGGENAFTLTAVDAQGGILASIEAEDVCVNVKGASMVSGCG